MKLKLESRLLGEISTTIDKQIPRYNQGITREVLKCSCWCMVLSDIWVYFWTLNSVACSVLTVASWLTYRFLRRQIKQSGIPIPLRIFHSLLWSTQSKALAWSKKQVFFLEFPYFFYDMMNVGNLISGSSAFPKSSLFIWKFLVHVLLKPSLKDFDHNLVSMRNKCNCAVLWTFFGTSLFGDGNENWPFPVLWPLLFSKFGVFQICWNIECSILTASFCMI